MSYETKILQKKGIVAGICNKIKLSNTIDELILNLNRKVSIGKTVKAMILNALGFSHKALYLTPHFYESRSVEHLVGKGIKYKFVHLDTTSFSLQGEYDNDQNEKMVKITKGYSKDNNPDLNQDKQVREFHFFVYKKCYDFYSPSFRRCFSEHRDYCPGGVTESLSFQVS